MYKMQCQDLEVFKNFFIFGSPKFVSPCPPAIDADIGDYVKDPSDHQTQVDLFYHLQKQEKKRMSKNILFRYLWMKYVNKWSCLRFVHT